MIWATLAQVRRHARTKLQDWAAFSLANVLCVSSAKPGHVWALRHEQIRKDSIELLRVSIEEDGEEAPWVSKPSLLPKGQFPSWYPHFRGKEYP